MPCTWRTVANTWLLFGVGVMACLLRPAPLLPCPCTVAMHATPLACNDTSARQHACRQALAAFLWMYADCSCCRFHAAMPPSIPATHACDDMEHARMSQTPFSCCYGQPCTGAMRCEWHFGINATHLRMLYRWIYSFMFTPLASRCQPHAPPPPCSRTTTPPWPTRSSATSRRTTAT